MNKEIIALDFIDDLIEGEITSGSIIRSRRKSLNLTQAEVADLTSFSPNYISAIENDNKPIGAKNAVRLAAALGLHPSSILFPNNGIDKESLKIIKRRDKLLSSKTA